MSKGTVQPTIVRTIAAVACVALGALIQRYYDAKHLPGSSALAATGTSVRLAGADFQQEPLWAYGFETPPTPGDTAIPQGLPTRSLRPNEDAVEQTKPRHIAGSNATYSLVDIRDLQTVADWFPNDHRPMPPVVSHGPVALGKAARACGSCHLPTGRGRPENAPVSGLPVGYFERQIQDFRSGKRRSADPRKPNTNTMILLARGMSDEELSAAATYFGSIPWTPWIRVVETDFVPRTRISGNLFLPVEQTKTVPIAGRIIEMPEDPEQSEKYRNAHSGFVAYVPVGSIARGKELVTTGRARVAGGEAGQPKTTPCTTCHGPELMGAADVPPIAGRSPSYIVRQLWDMKQGSRNGDLAQLMKPVLANLTNDDLVAIAAYVSSRVPGT
jgi:cytochrome c553